LERERHDFGMKARGVLIASAVSLTVSLEAQADSSWASEADVGVTVNGHAFHHVRVEGKECKLSVHLLFDAPEKGYADPRNTVRNYHLFRARVRLAKGQAAESKIFGNAGPGERQYAGAGCWTKEPGKVVKLDVIGCRGRGCDVGAFE